MEDLGSKFLKTVIGEVVGALFFVILITIVAALKDAMPEFPLSISQIVLLWVLYGIGTPIVIFSDVMDFFQDIIRNLR